MDWELWELEKKKRHKRSTRKPSSLGNGLGALVAQRKGRHAYEINISAFVATQIGHGINAFTKWWNSKEKHVGSVFTPLSRVEIRDDAQLLYTIAYVHRNPIHHHYATTLESYPWSSYLRRKDFRWVDLFDTEGAIQEVHNAAIEELGKRSNIVE